MSAFNVGTLFQLESYGSCTLDIIIERWSLEAFCSSFSLYVEEQMGYFCLLKTALVLGDAM